jgi:O-acetyl-ADP-ribose deacetylase (regulator of RNase III)
MALREKLFPTGALFQLDRGDITLENVDAIVNAANAQLSHGAGVAGAILRRGGPQIQLESDRWVSEHGPVSHSAPAYTHAGNLPCKYVIHAVGPIWGEGDEDEKLSAVILGALRIADDLALCSISFPAISTGIYRFPKPRAARIFYSSIVTYVSDHPETSLALIRLVIYDDDTLCEFLNAWDEDDHLRA